MTASTASGCDTPDPKGACDAGYTGDDLMKAAARRLRKNKPEAAQSVSTQTA